MSHLDLDVVLLTTIGLACAITFIFRRRFWLAMFLAFAVTLAGWVLLAITMDAEADRIRQQLDADEAKGRVLTQDESMYDGVGDRVAGLFGGWIPGLAGTILGCLISSPTWVRALREKRNQQRRGFDVLPS